MASFYNEIIPLLNAEGGLNTNPADRGGLTKYGISKNANPDIDIESLTPKKAASIYKTRYWDAIGGDNLPQGTAAVAFDAAVNHGVSRAKNLLKATGGDPVKMLEGRKHIYDSIVANDPSQNQFYNGWMNRLKNLSARLGDSLISPASADDAPNPELIAKYQEWKAAKAEQPNQELIAKYQQWKASKQNKNDWTGKDTLQAIRDIGGGVIEGVSDIGNTLLSAGDTYNEMIGNKNALSSLETTGKERKQQVKAALKEQRANGDSALYQAGKLGAAIAGTAGTGQALGAAVAPIPILSKIAPAISSSGTSGGNMLEKVVGGAISGGAQAGLINPEDAGIGAAIGGALPPLAKVAGVAGDAIGGLFQGDKNAAKQIIKQLDGELPKNAPNIPEFKNIEGVKPTVGMITDDPALLKLEMNARNRNKGGQFFERDAQNTGAMYNSIAKKAISDLEANKLQDALNLQTGQLRDEAFQKARENPVYREQLTKYFDELANTPGIRNSEAMPLIERGRKALIMMPKNEAAQDLGETVIKDTRVPWHKTPVDTEKDNMLTAITKLGGLNKDMAQSTYGNRMWEDVSLGLNTFRNEGGHSLDDMATLLAEKGYLPEGSGVYELVEKLYGNAKDTYSTAKSGYGYLDQPQSATDQLHSQLSDLIDALNKKNAPKQVNGKREMVSIADPEDIYTFRKLLNDKLKLKTISPDELDNAIKARRRLSVEMKEQLDKGLNEASGGAWSRYLKAHQEGMKPIEEGRAFQNILDRFANNKRIFGTDTPQVTPYALRKAVDDETFVNLGKQGYVSNISDEARAKLDEALKIMNGIEQARSGVVAVNGSPTASYANSLLEQGANAVTGSRIPAMLYKLVDSAGVTRGQKVLDDALLNPEKLQAILNKALSMQNAQPNQALPYLYRALPPVAAD